MFSRIDTGEREQESYHMIKGSMDVYLFENSGKVKEIIRLDANKNKKIVNFFINYLNQFSIQFFQDLKSLFITRY